MTFTFLVYRITIDFHTDLYQVSLLMILITLVDFSGFSLSILSSVSNGNFISSLLIYLLFPFYPIKLTRSSNSVLNGSSNDGHPCLDTDFEMFLAFYP